MYLSSNMAPGDNILEYYAGTRMDTMYLAYPLGSQN